MTARSLFSLYRKPLTRGLVLVGVLWALGIPAAVLAQTPVDSPVDSPADSPVDPPADFWGSHAVLPDTLDPGHEYYWGLIPARHDSVAAAFSEAPRPAWENAVLVPYWIVGVPFRAAYYVGDQTFTGMDKLGFFGGKAEYPGLKGPLGTYLMPSFSISGLEGLALGVNVQRPNFLKPGNKLFVRGKRSTKRAGAYAGGALFHLDRVWHLEVGGGFESVNQARYYGLGPGSLNGDLSYYYRATSWGGFDLNRDIAPSVQMGLRAYFSGVTVHEPSFNDDFSLDTVHAGALPFGYPGQSNGWTVRWALGRNNAEQNGRPKHGGYQSLAVSLFEASDGSDLSYLTWHANLEKFIKLWHTDRVLAVRGFASRISNAGSAEVPFSRLVTFQRPDQLRGFSSLRFYGLGAVGLSLEYRWPIWVVRGRDDMGVDAYLFTDSGQVFDHTSDLSLNNYQWTGGGGLRLISAERGMSARFELGLSDEDLVVRLTFNQTFQYNPRGFLYGKNPTKVR